MSPADITMIVTLTLIISIIAALMLVAVEGMPAWFIRLFARSDQQKTRAILRLSDGLFLGKIRLDDLERMIAIHPDLMNRVAESKGVSLNGLRAIAVDYRLSDSDVLAVIE